MCGRFQLKKNSESDALIRAISANGPVLYADDISPMKKISIIRQYSRHVRVIVPAIWWLCLDRETLKPAVKYSSFNSKYDKLNTKGSASYIPFRKSRCIIPATAFNERLAEEKVWHMIELQGSAIAFGGLFQDYLNPNTGETVTAASIITPP